MGTAANHDGWTDVTFTAEKHGTTTITVNGVQIEAEVKHPMYVKDNLHERDIDRINEWVDTATGWLPKENGYIHNAGNYYPYQLYNDDTLQLIVPVGSISGAKLEIENSAILSLESGNLYTADENGNLVITVRAHNTSQEAKHTRILLRDGNDNVIREMYIRIPKDNHELLDHADIEIADGGRYTVTKLIREADGTVKKYVTEYKAYVDGVNSSTLYQKTDNSTPCDFYYTSQRFVDENGIYYDTVIRYTDGNNTKYHVQVGGNWVEVTKTDCITEYDNTGTMTLYDIHETADSDTVTVTSRTQSVRTGIVGYISSNYGVDPKVTPGTPQYEFTSKYKIDSEGHYYDWSNIKYYASDVDHVIFDVKLALEPSLETVYIKDGNGVWQQFPSTSITADTTNTKHLNSVKFTMNHQDVLDAYNKCPNHTGLDFTVMAFSALVELNLNKKLTGSSTIQKDQFSFEILQKAVHPARKGYADTGTAKSNYSDLINSGLRFKGAYRIFYDQDTKWGEGIDSEAALRELNTIPEFQNLSVGQLFTIANDDRYPDQQKRLLRILQQYLTTPAAVTETETDYQLPQDGFYLLSFESEPVDTAKNNAEGVITFNALHYEKGGEYNYIIRESIPENSDGILFDRRELDLKIQVDEQNKKLTADIISDVTQFEFTNHMTYHLPDTGGCGTLPYYLGGTVLLAASSLLLIKKRREGR
jgi:pilin isopeptide linkage protein/LPXTG-motif cell wall-anchored protein